LTPLWRRACRLTVNHRPSSIFRSRSRKPSAQNPRCISCRHARYKMSRCESFWWRGRDSRHETLDSEPIFCEAYHEMSSKGLLKDLGAEASLSDWSNISQVINPVPWHPGQPRFLIMAPRRVRVLRPPRPSCFCGGNFASSSHAKDHPSITDRTIGKIIMPGLRTYCIAMDKNVVLRK
jgi:hypothetical protein